MADQLAGGAHQRHAHCKLTGQLAGPSMFEVATTLGREKVVARLAHVDHLFLPA